MEEVVFERRGSEVAFESFRAHVEPGTLVISAFGPNRPARPFVPAASTVAWASVDCVERLARPDVGLICADPSAPALAFREDGFATWGDLVVPWATRVWGVSENTLRVWAAKLLDASRIERQYRRIVELLRAAQEDVDRAREIVHAAGPVRGVANTRRGEYNLVSRPGPGGSLWMGSIRGNETERNDLAELWYRAENRWFRCITGKHVAAEALRLAIVRHLPPATAEEVEGRQAEARINGRSYWLHVRRNRDEGGLLKWEWLALPEQERDLVEIGE